MVRTSSSSLDMGSSASVFSTVSSITGKSGADAAGVTLGAGAAAGASSSSGISKSFQSRGVGAAFFTGASSRGTMRGTERGRSGVRRSSCRRSRSSRSCRRRSWRSRGSSPLSGPSGPSSSSPPPVLRPISSPSRNSRINASTTPPPMATTVRTSPSRGSLTFTGILSMGTSGSGSGAGSGSGSGREMFGTVPVYCGIRRTWTVYSFLVTRSSAVQVTTRALSPSFSMATSPVPPMPWALLSLATAASFTVFVSKGTYTM